MTDILFSVGDFDYMVVNQQHENNFVSVVADCFVQYEPLFSHLRSSQDTLEEFLRNILDNYLGRKLSVLCVHRPTQEVCGGFFSSGIHPDHPDHFSERIQSQIEPIVQFLDKLEHHFSKVTPKTLPNSFTSI